jgi:Methyltransferase FkbM domain
VVVLLAGIAGGFLAGMHYDYPPPRTTSTTVATTSSASLVVARGGGGGGSLLRGDVARSSASPPGKEEKDGWKVVHVFYGTTDHLASASDITDEAFRNNQFFGQVGQDEIVAKLFREKKDGYFLDLASNDAVLHSNTYGLERNYGWTGICVEAGPKFWLGLAHRTCHVVGALIGKDREDVQYVFRDVPGFSGIVGPDFDNKVAQRGRAEARRTVTLEEVFARFEAPRVIDYFSFDVEGAEDLVLQPSVLVQYRFNVLTIERPKQVLKDLLVANDYVFLKEISNFGETLWAHALALPDLDLEGAGIARRPT